MFLLKNIIPISYRRQFTNKTTRLPSNYQRFPSWLRTTIPTGTKYNQLVRQLKDLNLNTVCQEAKCPNIGECWNGKEATATIMLMGNECTRACRFCSVKTSNSPAPLDPREPKRVAQAISQWSVDYVVLTSVDRDDLDDFGAQHFTQTVLEVKQLKPSILVECLVGDFNGREELSLQVASSGLDVFAHNIETVERLTPEVRDRRASYHQSLGILQSVKKKFPQVLTKSSIMLGCGESIEEVYQTMQDLRSCQVDLLTIGQYIQPTKGNLKVKQYIEPSIFVNLELKAIQMGFKFAACGPLVRSSYKAGELFVKAMKK